MNLLNAFKPQQQRPIEDRPSEIYRASETLLEWEAPERVFKKYSREFYRRMAVILIFFGFLFLFVWDIVVIVVLGIVFFVVYTFHSIPPRKVIHKITTNGIFYAMDYHYMWRELRSYYFEKRDNVRYLIINTVDPLPGRLYLIIDKSITNEKIAEVLSSHLSFDEKPTTNVYEDMMKAFRSSVKLKSFSEE